MTASATSTKQKKRDLYSVLFIATLDNFGLGVVLILFATLLFNPQYALIGPTVSLGMRNVLYGIVIAAFPIAQFIGAPIFGDLADLVGRKRALLFTVLGTAAGCFLSALAIFFHSLLFLVITRLITGFFAGNNSLCLAAIADLAPEGKTRGKKFGIISVVYGISWILAILTGGFLTEISAALPFIVTGILAILCCIVVKIFFTEAHFIPHPPKFTFTKGMQAILTAFFNKKLRPFFILILAWAVGWGLAVQWFSAFNMEHFHLSQAAIAWSLVIQGLFWTFGGSVINPLILRKWRISSAALLGTILTISFLLANIWLDFYQAFIVLFLLASTCSVLIMSNGLTLASISAPSHVQGVTMGLTQSMIALGTAIAPLIGGVLGKVNINLVYPFCGFVLFACLAVLLAYRAHEN